MENLNHNEAFIMLRNLGLTQSKVAKGTKTHPTLISQAFRGKRPDILEIAVRYIKRIERLRTPRKLQERMAS